MVPSTTVKLYSALGLSLGSGAVLPRGVIAVTWPITELLYLSMPSFTDTILGSRKAFSAMSFLKVGQELPAPREQSYRALDKAPESQQVQI